jgi:NMD protein affecting ribosome stability and mRNA decay
MRVRRKKGEKAWCKKCHKEIPFGEAFSNGMCSKCYGKWYYHEVLKPKLIEGGRRVIDRNEKRDEDEIVFCSECEKRIEIDEEYIRGMCRKCYGKWYYKNRWTPKVERKYCINCGKTFTTTTGRRTCSIRCFNEFKRLPREDRKEINKLGITAKEYIKMKKDKKVEEDIKIDPKYLRGYGFEQILKRSKK